MVDILVGVMRHEPYIGITGFMTREEVETVMGAIPSNASRKFMVGVLASPKTIYGNGNKWTGRYPMGNDISGIFTDDPRAFNLIHYGDGLKSSEGLGEALMMIASDIAGPNLHGFQLNMAWPEAGEIAKFKEKFPEMQIVLQAGRWTLKDSTETALELVKRFRAAYLNGEVDYLILDISGGLGIELFPGLMVKNMKAIKAAALDIGITVAGGLHKGNLDLLDPILEICPDASVDAEGALRMGPDDHLVLSEAIGYTKGAYKKCEHLS